MSDLTLLEKIIIWAVPVVFAITVHEVAHGWVAYRLGDATAKSSGRLTLNPLKHIDPVGTVVLPLILLYIGGFVFGWARPVPVSWQNLGHPRRDMALVAMAGPAANLIMMLLWAILARTILIFNPFPTGVLELIMIMCSAGIIINIVLMVINLIPLLPLDGGRIMNSLLPPRLAVVYARLEPFGLIIIVLLLASGLLSKYLSPVVFAIETFIYQLIG